MKRIKENKTTMSGKIEDKVISDILFDELIISNADIKDTIFSNVHFRNSHLGISTSYNKCSFIRCKFYGKYSSFGKLGTYLDCRFENCEFIGTELFEGSHFKNCYLSGLIKNPILKDKHPRIENIESVFINCDLTHLTFDNVSIYGKNVFKNCTLPHQGIRLFDNTENKLIERAESIINKVKSNDTIDAKIIFNRDLKQGQNPIILDKIFLESFFKSESSRKIFEEIISGSELD